MKTRKRKSKVRNLLRSCRSRHLFTNQKKPRITIKSRSRFRSRQKRIQSFRNADAMKN